VLASQQSTLRQAFHDTRTCQSVFDLQRDVPPGAGARAGTCLSPAQKAAIAPIFSGATLSDGRRFYAPFPFDGGIGGAGTRCGGSPLR
jgi:feruloyl esterase